MLHVAFSDVDKILVEVSQLVNANVQNVSATISNLKLTCMFVLFLIFVVACFVLIYLVTKVTDVIQNNAAVAKVAFVSKLIPDDRPES